MSIITLTTDFGTSDGYGGIMKGVILGIAPDVTIADLSHEIAPQNIRQGAFVLKSACPYFPVGTIHVAVVDPGVGSERDIIAIQTDRAVFLAPDNGVLSWAIEDQRVEKIVRISEPQFWLPEVSQTFHGRDIFAPVAAHLARGLPIARLGPEISQWVRTPFPKPTITPDSALRGEIIYIDRFGNLVTNFRMTLKDLQVTNVTGEGSPLFLTGQLHLHVLRAQIVGLSRSYAEVAPGNLLAIVGSSGYLEIAQRNGHAADALRARVGDIVRVERGPSGEIRT